MEGGGGKSKKNKIKGKNQQEQSKASVLLVQPGPCSEKLWFKNRSGWGARTFYGVNQNKKKTKK
jgi:hypothetical protein